MTKEINGKLYNDEEMWKVINECTVVLIFETERERAERMVCQSHTSEEILVDRYTNLLYNSSDSVSDNEININANDVDLIPVAMDPEAAVRENKK